MRFSEIAAHIEATSAFPITAMNAVREGITVVITAQTADGKDANATLYLGSQQLAHPELIAVLAHDASEALARYVASFVPPPTPKWDDQRWGE